MNPAKRQPEETKRTDGQNGADRGYHFAPRGHWDTGRQSRNQNCAMAILAMPEHGQEKL